MYTRPVIKHMQILKFQVPIEEKEYLKDQRQKIGPKGSFSLDLLTKMLSKDTKKIQWKQRG